MHKSPVAIVYRMVGLYHVGGGHLDLISDRLLRFWSVRYYSLVVSMLDYQPKGRGFKSPPRQLKGLFFLSRYRGCLIDNGLLSCACNFLSSYVKFQTICTGRGNLKNYFLAGRSMSWLPVSEAILFRVLNIRSNRSACIVLVCVSS